jgi:hypothetical protein
MLQQEVLTVPEQAVNLREARYVYGFVAVLKLTQCNLREKEEVSRL